MINLEKMTKLESIGILTWYYDPKSDQFYVVDCFDNVSKINDDYKGLDRLIELAHNKTKPILTA